MGKHHIMAFENEKPGQYGLKLSEVFGYPDKEMPGVAVWDGMAGLGITILKDEVIEHAFPVPHTDFIYSMKPIMGWEPKDGMSTVDPEVIKNISSATGSISIDGLKGMATARCGMLIKNAVSLGFVQDVADGKITGDFKMEYSKRIKNNEYPEWYKDEMGEAEDMDKMGKIKQRMMVNEYMEKNGYDEIAMTEEIPLWIIIKMNSGSSHGSHGITGKSPVASVYNQGKRLPKKYA